MTPYNSKGGGHNTDALMQMTIAPIHSDTIIAYFTPQTNNGFVSFIYPSQL